MYRTRFNADVPAFYSSLQHFLGYLSLFQSRKHPHFQSRQFLSLNDGGQVHALIFAHLWTCCSWLAGMVGLQRPIVCKTALSVVLAWLRGQPLLRSQCGTRVYSSIASDGFEIPSEGYWGWARTKRKPVSDWAVFAVACGQSALFALHRPVDFRLPCESCQEPLIISGTYRLVGFSCLDRGEWAGVCNLITVNTSAEVSGIAIVCCCGWRSLYSALF